MIHKYLRVISGIAIALGAANIIWPVLPSWVAYALLVAGSVLVLIEVPGIVRDVGEVISRLPIRGPFRWDFKGFLGVSWRSKEAVHVTVFQTSGENIGRHPAEILDAKIQSYITGEQIDVTFKTNGGYTTAKNLNPIPPGAKFSDHALFYDPGSRGPDEREGLPEDVFLASWGEFQFNVKTRKRNYRRRFSNKEVVNDIARVKPSPVATRRISRKNVRIDQEDRISFIKFNPNTFEIIDVGGNVTGYDDNGMGDYGITFVPPLDENNLICTAVGETPQNFEIISFAPDYIRLKFNIDPEIIHLRFGL